MIDGVELCIRWEPWLSGIVAGGGPWAADAARLLEGIGKYGTVELSIEH